MFRPILRGGEIISDMIMGLTISIWEVLLLMMFLGSVTFIAFSIGFILLIRKRFRKRSKFPMIVICILQLALSAIITLPMWSLAQSLFDQDTLGPLFLPTAMAEILTIPLFAFIANRITRKK